MTGSLVACESCDLLHRAEPLGRGRVARCTRCGQNLYSSDVDSLERTLAFSVAALVLLLVANAAPFMTVSLEGQVQDNHIVSGVIDLASGGYAPLAGLILLTTVVAPFLEILLYIWAIVPVLLGWRVPGVVPAARLSSRMATWSMLEVYLLAVIVAGVKLAMMAQVHMDVGAFAFFGMIVLLTAARSALQVEALWNRIEATQ
jgi:paraquat-inducible protein A